MLATFVGVAVSLGNDSTYTQPSWIETFGSGRELVSHQTQAHGSV